MGLVDSVGKGLEVLSYMDWMAPKAKVVVAAALDGMSDDEMVARFGPKKKAGQRRAGGPRQIVQQIRDL